MSGLVVLLALQACDADSGGGADAEDSGAGDTAGDTGDTGDTGGVFDPPDWCPPATAGRQEVTDTPASPYYILHPDVANAPIVLFLPGGPGDRGSAGATWTAFFDEDSRGYRIVVPYVTEAGYPQTVVPPSAGLLDEVLACFGGDPGRVHLAGHSNGGYLAYNVFGPELADRIITITGAPAYFEDFRQADFGTLAFHNAAGAEDATWLAAMEGAHETLLSKGFESQLTAWAATGHTPGPNWDGREGMFAFWDAH